MRRQMVMFSRWMFLSSLLLPSDRTGYRQLVFDMPFQERE